VWDRQFLMPLESLKRTAEFALVPIHWRVPIRLDMITLGIQLFSLVGVLSPFERRIEASALEKRLILMYSISARFL
jgi:hypothetical protein